MADQQFVVPLGISQEILHNFFHLTGTLIGKRLKIGVDVFHAGDFLILDAQVITDEWADIVGIVLLIVARILLNGVPVTIVVTLLFLNVEAHQDEVPDFVALIQFEPGRVEALKNELRIIVRRCQRDVDDLQLFNGLEELVDCNGLLLDLIVEEQIVLSDV